MNNESSIDKQFGYFNNLLIGLATGLLTFLLHLAFNTDFHIYTSIVRILVSLSTVILFCSLLLGVLLAWKRIEHYRLIWRHNKLEEHEKADHYKKVAASEINQRLFLKYQGITFLLASLSLLLIIIIVIFQGKVIAP